MRVTLVFCFFVSLTSAEYGWNGDYEYDYKITGRTLTGIHQVANQYSGVFIRAKLKILVDSDKRLTLQVNDAQYADIHQNLESGWSTHIPDNQLNYNTLPINNNPFHILLKNGVVKYMVVEKNLTKWELNFIKSIVSQLQLDTQGVNLKKSETNDVPQVEEKMGSFRTMEDSINGIYETMYDISPLPEYIFQSRPELVPFPNVHANGQHINIVKTRDFSSSKQHIIFHNGMDGQKGWVAGSNQMGNFLARFSTSRIIISGNLKKYIIQSSETTEKVLVSPQLYNNKKGIVASQINLTLQSISPKRTILPPVSIPKRVESLVYELQCGKPLNWNERKNEKFETVSSSSGSSEITASIGNDEILWSLSQRQKLRSKFKSSKQSISNNKDENIRHSQELANSSSDEDLSISSLDEYLPEQTGLPEVSCLEYTSNTMRNLSEKEQISKNIARVSRLLGQWILNPNNILNHQILSYFSILTKMVATANSEQLRDATDQLYYPEIKFEKTESKEESQEYQAWQAFRDAVAQAGTGPALVTLQDWITSAKIQENEAAQLIAVLPNSARYPTPEYMGKLFEMLKSKNIQKQNYLNNTIVMAFTDLIRKTQIDTKSSKHYYPIHLSGDKSQKHYRIVYEKYIPYFKEQLKNAYIEQNSAKIQIFIRALGNTAHTMIFSVFKPYLEGKYTISTFQRLLMIASLDEITRVHPNTARSVLYRIYQNQGEAPEIRVAAVMQLMKTNPSAQLLQRMAEQTNYDHSIQVNAAVKSAIESAAKGEYPIDEQLIKNARSAINFLTSENYGAQYSKIFIQNFILKEEPSLQYQQQVTYIQGIDSIYPSSVFYNLHPKIGGYNQDPQMIHLMTSSSEELLKLLSHKVIRKNQDKQEQLKRDDSKYSFGKLLQTFKTNQNETEAAEGNILISLFAGKRFFTFNSVQNAVDILQHFQQKLQNGVHVEESKFYDQYSLEIEFPLAMGIPFTYSLSTPSLTFFGARGKGSLQNILPLTEGELKGQLQFVYSTQRHVEMGFNIPFSNKRYIAGVVNNMEIYMPLKGKIEINGKVMMSLKLETGNIDIQRIFQYSTNIYTTYQNSNDVKPTVLGENVKLINIKPLKTYKKSFTYEETGSAFEVEVRGENSYQDFAAIHHVMKNTLYNLYMDKYPSNKYFAISYNPKNNSPQDIQLSLSLQSVQNTGELSSKIKTTNFDLPLSVHDNREKALNNLMSGVKDGQAHLIDMSISLSGNGNAQYILTGAYAESDISENSRLVMFYSGGKSTQNIKPFQVILELNIKKPQSPIMNYNDALNTDPTSFVKGEIKLGQSINSNIAFQGKMERSQERKQYLINHSISQTCQEQMKQRNYIQPSCMNAITNAYYLDKYNFVIKYQKVKNETKDYIYNFYKMLCQMTYIKNMENVINKKNKELLSINAQFVQNLQSLNVTIDAPTFSSHFENIMLPQYAIPILVQNSRYGQMSLLPQEIFNSQPLFSCSLDINTLNTFNNKSYPVDLGNCYYIMAMHVFDNNKVDSQEYSEKNNRYRKKFAVLVKDVEPANKMVLIVLENDEVLLESKDRIKLSINGKNIEISDNKVARWQNGDNIIESYLIPKKATAVVYVSSHEIQVTYDGSRVLLYVHPKYRNRIRGLCGKFNGDVLTDFSSPEGCIIKDHEEFSAHYALWNSTCQKAAKYLQKQSQHSVCYRNKIVLGDVVSEDEFEHKEIIKKDNVLKTHSKLTQDQSCSIYRTKIMENTGKTCFSLRPQVTCSPHCIESKTIEKTVSFHCVEDSSAARHWKEIVKKGANPDFTQKATTIQTSLKAPEKCIPKSS